MTRKKTALLLLVVLIVLVSHQAHCHPLDRTRHNNAQRKDDKKGWNVKDKNNNKGGNYVFRSSKTFLQARGGSSRRKLNNDPPNSELEQRLSLEEIGEEITTKSERRAIGDATIKDLGWLMTLAFLCGSSISISNNLLGRWDRSLPFLGSHTITPFGLSAWLFTIGTFGFTAQSILTEKNRWEFHESAAQALFQWSSSSRVAPPKVRRRWWGVGGWRRAADNQSNCNRIDLKQILEGFSMSVPNETIDTLYREIDPENTGQVTQSHIHAAFVGQRNNQSKLETFRAILTKCIQDWGFWSNLTWLIGSLSFLAASYIQLPPSISQGGGAADTQQLLLQAGAIFYLLGGMALLVVLWEEQFQKKVLSITDRVTFWLSSLFVVAGVLFTLESYGDSLGLSDRTRSNMLLVASSCYAMNSSKKVVGTPIMIAWTQEAGTITEPSSSSMPKC